MIEFQTATSETTLTKPETHISQVLKKQGEAVSLLHAQLETLYKKLSRVIRPEQTGDTPDKVNGLSVYVDLAMEIDQNNERIISANRKINDIIERLEL